MAVLKNYLGSSFDETARQAGYANAEAARQAGYTFEDVMMAKPLTTPSLAPIGGAIISPSVLPIAGGFGAGVGALPSAATLNQPLFASNIDVGAEAERLRQERKTQLAGRAAEAGTEARRIQGLEAGGAQAMAGKGGQAGVGWDSIVAGQINETKKTLEKNLTAIESALGEAILKGDEVYIDRIQKVQTEARDAYYQALSASIAQEQLKIQQLTGRANVAESEVNIASKITAGTSWTSPTTGQVYTGIGVSEIEPFFKGSDIVNLMKALPVGQTQEITDPSTGTIFTLNGLASSDPNLKQFTATDDKGNVSIINYDPNTGAVVSQTKVSGVGKTKTGPSMVSVNFPRMTQAPIYDKSGKQIGFAWSNPIVGTTDYKDMVGNIIQLPEGATIGTFAAGNPLTGTEEDLPYEVAP